MVPGTFGENECDELDQPEKCAIFADMLGDAVVWFAILPRASATTVELPPIIDLDAGGAVLLVSADLDEILALADRVLVMVRGRIAGALAIADCTEAALGRLMAGAGQP